MNELEGSNLEQSLQEQIKDLEAERKRKRKKQLLIHLLLFVVTFIGTTLAGAEWSRGKFILHSEDYTWADFIMGMEFSIPFLLILTFHEFGHYFTAQYYKIKVTLPYYLPLWLGFLPVPSPSIGTMGAFISIKGKIQSRKQYFDIGIAGPLAGFVIALFVLWYGFSNLPSPDIIYEIHPEYKYFGDEWAVHVYERDTFILREDLAKINPVLAENLPDTAFRYGKYSGGGALSLGDNILFSFFKEHVAEQHLLPHNGEIIHYPWLLAGYLALFFTALNLLPIGQLDGGHILYGLLGLEASRKVSAALFILFVGYAGMGIVTPYMPMREVLTYIPLYGLFLYLCMYSLSEKPLDRLTAAIGVLAVQFVLSYLFPTLEGYSGWLLYGLLLGRFIGIYHPPVPNNAPLDWKRKVLGWIALIIFITSWSPRLLIVS